MENVRGTDTVVTQARGSRTLEFWISNLVIIFSTVLGVYLAAKAGYGTAVQFELVRTEREGYFMRRALLDEVRDNVASIDAWGADFEKLLRDRISADYMKPEDTWLTYYVDNGGYQPQKGGPTPKEPKLKTFIWESMKQQSATFQVPPAVLSAVRRYYDNVAENAAEVTKRTVEGALAARAIVTDTNQMRDELLPKFEKDAAELEARLKEKGIPLS
jgi:hypothetical protein